MLQQLIWFVHVCCALFIIILVLLQYGKGTEFGVAIGGASQTFFGSKGSSSFITKLTSFIALLFAITSISLSFFVHKKDPLVDVFQDPALTIMDPGSVNEDNLVDPE